MWDFEHDPARSELATRYELNYMLPSECADQLATGAADVGLIPIAALAAHPQLRVLPGCTIASKGRVRSLLLVRRKSQLLSELRRVAADTASRTTIAHARILLNSWGAQAEMVPMQADLDAMLQAADAAVVIGDPALTALEERIARQERTGEELVYHDLAAEWRQLTGLPFVSAVWATRLGGPDLGRMAEDFLRSRDHGLEHIEDLVRTWAPRLSLPEPTVRTYLTENIHYVLDDECRMAMRAFFERAAELGVLPSYDFRELASQRVSKSAS